jgi:hypothetical protein
VRGKRNAYRILGVHTLGKMTTLMTGEKMEDNSVIVLRQISCEV